MKNKNKIKIMQYIDLITTLSNVLQKVSDNESLNDEILSVLYTFEYHLNQQKIIANQFVKIVNNLNFLQLFIYLFISFNISLFLFK
jgi:hypothetical protein